MFSHCRFIMSNQLTVLGSKPESFMQALHHAIYALSLQLFNSSFTYEANKVRSLEVSVTHLFKVKYTVMVSAASILLPYFYRQRGTPHWIQTSLLGS